MARLRTDWILFLTIVAMVFFGLVMLYSASSAVAELRYHVAPYYFVVRQIGWAIVSFMVLMYFKRMDYRRLNSPTWAFSGLGIVLGLLVLVYFVDPHAHRWFKLPGVGSFQPSEFAKPALILFLAYFIARRAHIINDRRTIKQALVAVLMLGFMVVVADLGTALVPVITAVIVFWIAGLERKYMLRVGLIAMALVVVAIASRGYRLGRIIAYVDPDYSKIEIDRPRRPVESLHAAIDQRARRELSAAAIADRGGHRRRVRHGIDAGQTEADVPAGRAHRFYFRHGRRRTGPVGIDGRDHRVPGDPVARGASVHAGARRFWKISGAGSDGFDRGAGVDQYECGGGHRAHERFPAAHDQLRRQFAPEHAGVPGNAVECE